MTKHIILLLFIGLVFAQEITIAVLDFDGDGVSQSETRTLTNRLRDEMFKTGAYIVLERGKMDEVLKEQGFQQTGCVTSECAVEVGNMLGVQQMIGGSIGKVGTVYTVSARIFDVQTGKILKSANYDHIGDIGQLLLKGMSAVVQQLITGKSSNNQVEISTTSRVPDTGNADARQEVTERWQSGLKKTVVIYKGSGINETIEKVGFTEDGKLSYRTEPGTGWKYQIQYFDNGNIKNKGVSKVGHNGKIIYDRLWTHYYDNEQMKNQITYKDGKADGMVTYWHQNGQMKSRKTYKDGKMDGMVTWWYKSGQKSGEAKFKDDKREFLKQWNEDGSLKE